ncbi:hypothetical protein RHMOL_Rhmol05G0141600 [Rhododendron molle]|uniref:Uncharacterized protein n=1 Tax=Rhododendron molle TaxID=49168 RepID=A0ACC0NP08_RHOML|nr:hypothetical protein RHMOL_Rhmol05G0141600 [Rhododendron molle]
MAVVMVVAVIGCRRRCRLWPDPSKTLALLVFSVLSGFVDLAQSYSESSDEGHEAHASGNSVGEGASNSVPANPASTSIGSRVSRNTTRADTLAEFKLDKEQFINEEFAGFSRGTSVSFTSDMWSGGNNRGYMALTAHYIDSSWKLNKRIIAFRLVEYPYNSTTIFQTVYGVFTEYNLADKVFSITFDNHSANTASIDMFLANLSPIHSGPLVNMEDKFKKYFEPMPKIFVFATVMDPRIKLCGVDRLLKGLSNNMSVLFYSIATVKKDLIDLYDLYESKYASTNVASTCPDPCLPRPSVDDPGWSLMSDDASDSFDFDTADTSARSELSIYLETERIKITNNQQNFDILGWWQQHAPTFPVLNIMARDLLTLLVSSVPSESAFSAGERVLDDKRSRLAPDILDCLMCLKDWEDTRLGIHPRAAKDELRDYFADSDIDDE